MTASDGPAGARIDQAPAGIPHSWEEAHGMEVPCAKTGPFDSLKEFWYPAYGTIHARMQISIAIRALSPPYL